MAPPRPRDARAHWPASSFARGARGHPRRLGGSSGAEATGGTAVWGNRAEAVGARALVRPRNSREEKFQKNCLCLTKISVNQETLKHHP